MGQIRIADRTYALSASEFVAYHCQQPEADWNLALAHQGRALWLSGTVIPAPLTVDDLDRATARVDLRSLDELAGALLGREVTLFPGGQDVCEIEFPLARTPAGVRLAVAVTCDWDRYLETFPRDAGPIELALEIDAPVAALHPGRLPST